jgi:hypothetical protein
MLLLLFCCRDSSMSWPHNTWSSSDVIKSVKCVWQLAGLATGRCTVWHVMGLCCLAALYIRLVYTGVTRCSAGRATCDNHDIVAWG